MAGVGALFEVLGHMRFSASGRCPRKFEGSVVKLKNTTGEVFEVAAEAACASAKVRAAIIANGVDEEIAFPVGKELMSKVIDYMKHHKDTPCSEIRTPLESDNLVECGASKFDSGFVKVDKDKLFDLILAATLFDMQSLFLLASAQASIMFKEKSSDKLRKDLGMNNDFSESDAEDMRNMINALRGAKGKKPIEEDTSDLAINAAVLAGVAAAANKAGVPADKKKEAGLLTIGGKSWKLASWASAIMMDWRILERAPAEVCGDRDIMSMAIAVSLGGALQYASASLASDKSLILEAVQFKGAAFEGAGSSLKDDKSFVAEAVKVSGAALQGAADSLRSDAAFVLEVTETAAGSAVKGAAASLTRDSGFILSAVVKDPEAYKYASDDLKEDKQFAITAAAKNGLTLQYMSSAFRADKDIVITAVMENKMAALYAHASRRADLLDSDDMKAASVEAKFGTIDQKAPLPPGGMRITCSWDEGVEFNGSFFHKGAKLVQFSASSTMTANMGQANYIASNSYLDKLPFYERPVYDSNTIMWGAVGNIGMRWKAFASADFLNATPEALLSVSDCCKILNVTCAKMDAPEWYNTQHYDIQTREAVIRITAGFGSGGGYKPSEDAVAYPTIPEPPALTEKPVEEEAQEEEDLEDIPGSPLGGWPELLAPAEALAPRLAKPFLVGARVRLVGLASKNGLEGILLRQLSDGKWKVALADGSGNALLKSPNMEVISYPEEDVAVPAAKLGKQVPFLKKEGVAKRAAEQAALKEAAAQRIAERQALAEEDAVDDVDEVEDVEA